MKLVKIIVPSLAVLALLATATCSFAFKGQKLSGEAKVDLRQARQIALKAQPGKIVDQELEKEKGGFGLRYSFDIRHGKLTREVGVDARTGKVLENSPEGAHAD
ncbi:MAG: PepSY domain-containing protein [Syntrophobacteraceae bacterium]|nr:PepSY domain-containing protein [Syntrophobacteraceae bacterium]